MGYLLFIYYPLLHLYFAVTLMSSNQPLRLRIIINIIIIKTLTKP